MPILWSRFVAENHFDSSLQFSVGANLISMHYFWINKSIGGKRSLYLLYSIIWWLVASCVWFHTYCFIILVIMIFYVIIIAPLALHFSPASHQITNMKFNHFLCIQYRYCNFKFLLWELRVGSNQDLGRGSFNQIWSILDSMKATNFSIL